MKRLRNATTFRQSCQTKLARRGLAGVDGLGKKMIPEKPALVEPSLCLIGFAQQENVLESRANWSSTVSVFICGNFPPFGPQFDHPNHSTRQPPVRSRES